MKTNILEALQKLGLTSNEAAIYSALLGVKKASALNAAAAAGIKRPTAYLVLESLIQKKLVAQTKYRGVRDYRALPLENLKHFVQAQHAAATQSLPAIQKLYNERALKVRLRVYHTISDVKLLLEKSLREKSPLHVFGSEQALARELGEYWEFFLKRSRQLNAAPKFKSVNGPVIVLLWSDKIAFVTFTDTVQVFGFKNKALHDFYQKLWTNF